MNKMPKSIPSAGTDADSELQPIDITSSQHSSKPNVACRFGLSHRFGLSLITWYSNKRKLSLEATLRIGAKYLNFIYHSSPFSMCQRKRFVKNVKSFFALTAPVELYLIAVSVVSLLQCCLVVWLSKRCK